MAIKQGTVSTFPLPSPVKAQVANPTAGGNPLELVDPHGQPLQVVDFNGLRYSLRLMQDAINKLENPPASSVAAQGSIIANTILEASASGSTYSNIGVTYQVNFTLPQAELSNPPLSFNFYVSAAQILRIVASGGAKIQNGATTSAANGYTEDSTSGEAVTLTCLSVNLWVAHPISGTHWTTV